MIGSLWQVNSIEQMSRWGSPTLTRCGDPGPKKNKKRKRGETRTVRLRLLTTPGQEKALEELGDLYARMWNKVTYEPRQLYFQGRLA